MPGNPRKASLACPSSVSIHDHGDVSRQCAPVNGLKNLLFRSRHSSGSYHAVNRSFQDKVLLVINADKVQTTCGNAWPCLSSIALFKDRRNVLGLQPGSTHMEQSSNYRSYHILKKSIPAYSENPL